MIMNKAFNAHMTINTTDMLSYKLLVHGTARVFKIEPWNSMKFHETARIITIWKHKFPWTPMDFYSISNFQLSMTPMVPWNPMHPISLQWRHSGRDGVSNHQPHRCLLNRFLKRGPKKTQKLRVTGFCARISPVAGEFPAQLTSNA